MPLVVAHTRWTGYEVSPVLRRRMMVSIVAQERLRMMSAGLPLGPPAAPNSVSTPYIRAIVRNRRATYAAFHSGESCATSSGDSPNSSSRPSTAGEQGADEPFGFPASDSAASAADAPGS